MTAGTNVYSEVYLHPQSSKKAAARFFRRLLEFILFEFILFFCARLLLRAASVQIYSISSFRNISSRFCVVWLGLLDAGRISRFSAPERTFLIGTANI